MEKTEIAATKTQVSEGALSWVIPVATIRITAGRQGIKYRARKTGRTTDTARTAAIGTTSQAKTRAYPQPFMVSPSFRHSRHAANTASAAAITSSVRSGTPPLPARRMKNSSTVLIFTGGIHRIELAPTVATIIAIGIIRYANQRTLRARRFQGRSPRRRN